jgi:antirestriction protein
MSFETPDKHPFIFVGTYAKYENGSKYGQWLDLTDYSNINEFYKGCKELHSDEDEPEFMFHIWENVPEQFISESHLSEKYFDYQKEWKNRIIRLRRSILLFFSIK